MSKGAVSRWESDQDQPQFAVLAGLKQALRVSLDYLICGEVDRRQGLAVGDSPAPYDVLDEREWRLVRAVRQMPEAQRTGLLQFLAPEEGGGP